MSIIQSWLQRSLQSCACYRQVLMSKYFNFNFWISIIYFSSSFNKQSIVFAKWDADLRFTTPYKLPLLMFPYYRVQWVCAGCGKRQPIRIGSFFFKLQCSILQVLQMTLAWCEDVDITVALQHFGKLIWGGSITWLLFYYRT